MANTLRSVEKGKDRRGRLTAEAVWDHNGVDVSVNFRREIYDAASTDRIEKGLKDQNGKPQLMSYQTLSDQQVADLANFQKTAVEYTAKNGELRGGDVALQVKQSTRNFAIPEYFAASPVDASYNPTPEYIDRMLDKAQEIQNAREAFTENKKAKAQQTIKNVLDKADSFAATDKQEQIEAVN